MSTLNQQTDGELISKYQESRNELAAKELLQRHYDSVLKQFRSKLSLQDSEDCAQILWTRFFNNIDNYEDSGRLEHYLSTAVSNLKKEHWRNTGTRNKHIASEYGKHDGDDDMPDLEYADDTASIEDAAISNEMISHLVNKLIPGLPPEQRMLWLLQHESEFWDLTQPLSWETLAQLNGTTTDIAWDRFESARNSILGTYNNPPSNPSDIKIDPEGMLVYLVWTQANRPDKKTKYTMQYFSTLLNEPENTLKTRYRKTRIKLDSELTAYSVPAGA